MKKPILFFVIFELSFLSHGADMKSFLASSDTFFKKYVINGSVVYSQVKQNLTEIEGLYRQIGEMNVEGLDENSKKTFYINSYNLIVIYWVTKYYPLKSPLDQKGFFDKIMHKVGGEDMTLNLLEIEKLLKPYRDARFHFVLTCAAKSCPPLSNFAYEQATLDQQLTDRTTDALNNPDWLKINKGQKKVELSKIFEWYKNDFMVGGKSEIEWINQFRKEKIPIGYSVGFYEYDWSLNER